MHAPACRFPGSRANASHCPHVSGRSRIVVTRHQDRGDDHAERGPDHGAEREPDHACAHATTSARSKAGMPHAQATANSVIAPSLSSQPGRRTSMS